MGFIKGLLTFIGLVLVVTAVGLIIAATRFPGGAAFLAERGMGRVLGTQVRCGKVECIPWRSALVLKDVRVFNGKPFEEDVAIRCEKIVVRLRPQTVFSETPVVTLLRLEDVAANLRYELETGTNLGLLARNASSFAQTHPTARQLQVEQMHCTGATMRLQALPEPLPNMKLDIAPFDMQDSLQQGAVSTAKLSVVLVRSLMREAVTLNGLLEPILDLFQRDVESLEE